VWRERFVGLFGVPPHIDFDHAQEEFFWFGEFVKVMRCMPRFTRRLGNKSCRRISVRLSKTILTEVEEDYPSDVKDSNGRMLPPSSINFSSWGGM